MLGSKEGWVVGEGLVFADWSQAVSGCEVVIVETSVGKGPVFETGVRL